MNAIPPDEGCTEEVLLAALRTNFYAFVRWVFNELHKGTDEEFVDTWHVEVLCFQFQKLAEGKASHLLVTVPPRHLKSIIAAVAYGAWVLGKWPGRKIIVATYGAELSEQHAHQFRRIVESDRYRQIFPNMRLSARGNRTLDMRTTKGGYRKGVSVQGSVTGFGATDIIMDDLLKEMDAPYETERQKVKDFYTSLYSRFNNKREARIASIQQRLHEDDLPGHLLNQGTYEHLNLKAIAEDDENYELYEERTVSRQAGEPLFPAREPLDALERIRHEIGAFHFSARYQQNPIAPDGNLIKREWLHLYDEVLEPADFERFVQSWDTAITAFADSDYSVCVTAGYRNGKWYVVDVWRSRLEHPTLLQFIKEYARRWGADRVLVELATTGHALLSELRTDDRSVFRGVRPEGDKASRLIGQTGKIERGDVLFDANADWLSEFRRELLAFPNGRYDDQVDALSQFLRWLDFGDAARLLNRDPVTNRPRRRQRPRRNGRPLPRIW